MPSRRRTSDLSSRGLQPAAMLMHILLASLSAGTAHGQPYVLDIVQNGQVVENPQFPYIGHGYEYDQYPGDNDLPWLREYAAMHGLFADVNMDLDWKDREFDMMRAIAQFTAENFHWTGITSVPDQDYRALIILALNDVFGDQMEWSCGSVSAAAIGLAQAHGIPARYVNGITDARNGDVCLEMFSTRYNRWIHFFPKGYNWIEHETLGPIGLPELIDYDLAGMIQIEMVNGRCIAIDNPPLVFMPTPVNNAPVWPYYTEWWWTGYFRHAMVSTKTQPNRSNATYDNSFLFVCQDNFMNDAMGQNRPVWPIADWNVSYPLNNVQAAIEPVPDEFAFSLTHNMFDFVKYQARVNDGPWGSLEDAGVYYKGDSDTVFNWYPESIPSDLTIRGVSRAAVHSPDVILRVTLAADLLVDGQINGLDIAEFVVHYLAADPLHPPPSVDLNKDGILDAADIAEFVAILLMQE